MSATPAEMVNKAQGQDSPHWLMEAADVISTGPRRSVIKHRTQIRLIDELRAGKTPERAA